MIKEIPTRQIVKRVKPLTPEQQDLTMSVDALAWKMAKQYAHYLVPDYSKTELRIDLTEQLHAGAMCEVMQAAKRFEPARGWKFTTYASHYIRAGIQRAAKELAPGGPSFANHDGFAHRQSDDKLVSVVSLNEIMQADGGEFFRLSDVLPERPKQERDIEAERNGAEMWDVARRVLSTRHLFVLWCRYVVDMGLREIGREIGISKERVRQIERGALSRLRKHLGVEGVGDSKSQQCNG